MFKRTIVFVFSLGALLTVFCAIAKKSEAEQLKNIVTISPFAEIIREEKPEDTIKSKSIFNDKQVLNVLLIGTDTSMGRRERGQVGFNTDVLVLVSVDTVNNTALLTSVPRDLWIKGNKINALYTVFGWETLSSAFEEITGQHIDGYITLDFDGFRWLVDAFGGIPVEIKTTFADYEFPNVEDSDVMPISFTQGSEKMTGDRALIYARSRKGNNGEGSDLMRAKRQHLILKGMVNAISQPESLFWPMDIPKFYELITQHMETSLTISDVYYLWDFYKDRDKYTVESFVVGDEYLYHPGMYPDSPYHAWVFIPRNDSFESLRNDITSKLNRTYINPTSSPSGN